MRSLDPSHSAADAGSSIDSTNTAGDSQARRRRSSHRSVRRAGLQSDRAARAGLLRALTSNDAPQHPHDTTRGPFSAVKLGYDVAVVADACGTMTPLGDQTTFDRLRGMGVTVAVTNQMVTELVDNCGTPDADHDGDE